MENSHPAIITPEVFDLVQHEFKKRKGAKGYKTGKSCFSGKIICGQCGSFYGSKVWHSTSKYRRTIWQCNNKFKNEEKCKTPHIYEDTLKSAFLEAFNDLLENRDEILQGYEAVIQTVTDTTKLDRERAKLQRECEVVAEFLRKCVEENATSTLYQKEYQERYTGLVERYESIKEGIAEIDGKRLEYNAKRESIEEFIHRLKKSDILITEFDEELWNATNEKAVVHAEHEITFVFKDGREIKRKV